VRWLLDTQIVIWASGDPARLPRAALRILSDEKQQLVFSAASLWEIVIKRSLARSDFEVDPRRLRRGLLDHGYRELPVTSEHALAVDSLPPLHKDPFDRMLIAQAQLEGLMLLTADAQVAKYPGPIKRV
jgi:PIN domain nuclease of toxin-antitoxin system